MSPPLVVFSGLPGVGKTTLARRVADDADEHRRRVDFRVPDLLGNVLPTWDDVGRRRWQDLREDHLLVDNIGDPQPHVDEILAWLGG